MGRLTHRTLPGSTYFVTTKAWQNVALFQVRETANIVVSKLLEYRDSGYFLLHEFVLMPNHLHLILTPSTSVSLEKVMQLIKGGSSYEIHRVRGTRMQTWQPGFHESRVRDSEDYKKKADYVRFNPVAAKLVERPEDWLCGSASGKLVLDPIPQGLKPRSMQSTNVGPKGPTPKTIGSKGSPSGPLPSGPKAPVSALTPGLKPRTLQSPDVGPKGPTPKTIVTAAKA